ncbi:MAG: DUF3427 domain-containing protein [Blastocatellales bacterium]|nr:DUF3427 domain-containing protein [Blastocatellales bacterium]
MGLRLGIYEEIINQSLEYDLQGAGKTGLQCTTRALDPGDSHEYLSRYVARQFSRVLSMFPAQERLERQTELTNQILELLSLAAPDAAGSKDYRVGSAELLLAVSRALEQVPPRPDTPLSISCLMTGTRQDPSLVSQLRKEIATADRVDILCSFIKWGGVRILDESLKRLTESGKPLRVITTTYMGATDLKAVERLSELPNTGLRVSYDARRTRLHAKAYIIHRETGFGVAYIGSSNLSQAALTDGLEWNVKISQHESPHLWEKISATFETYWEDPEFIPYCVGERERLQRALGQQSGISSEGEGGVFFDLKPYPFQEEILQRLEAERDVRGRNRNLVVAATGTGKTVVAAFDYARFRRKTGASPRLLFVAHREEILTQSRACFRAVLRDNNFGDLLVGTHAPERLDHLFASIQSINSRKLWDRIEADFYDFVVIDEFHHAAASSYKRLLDWICPQILLGLTATPERADGLDILHYFSEHIAAEIRLPDAINRKLLAPFQYFGISDDESVNYRKLQWKRGGYVTGELDNLVTGNDVRADLVVRQVHRILLDARQARGLGFCVSVRHAEYMAKHFRKRGIPAEALSADSPRELRESIQRRLEAREINFIFVVDLYNEGVDLPWVDTILLLRPTESLTVFLQQLGRGLRLHEDKECLTILDFIGQAHANFNFEARFRALIGRSHRRVESEIEDRFPHLPAGCVIDLERQAQQYILDNIREAITHGRQRIIRRIRSYKEETGRTPDLGSFVEYHHLELSDIYRRGSWSRLMAEAGCGKDFSDPDEKQLAGGLSRMTHINSGRQIKRLLEILDALSHGDAREPNEETDRRYLFMLHFTLWGRENLPASLNESLMRLRANPTLLAELRELLAWRLESVNEVPQPMDLPFPCPLDIHSDYTRDEILAALGELNFNTQRQLREGVLYVPSLPADLLFVTLNKTEQEYSPTTMYEDYAISEKLFHWQSQSTTSAQSPTGKRYVNHQKQGSNVLLFVRETKELPGRASPYTFLGPVIYRSHHGSRPMSIIWELACRLPASLLRTVRRLAND